MEGKTRNKFFTVFIAAILGLTLCSTAGAATLTVGLPEGGTYGTVAEAILDAADGDTIQIMSSLHTEAGIVVSKNLTITGAGSGSTTVQAHASRGMAADRVFEIDLNATVVIQDMTIQHGRAPDGAPGSNAGDPGIAGGNGGGVLNNGNLTLRNCSIVDNIAGNGGDGLAGENGQVGDAGQNGVAGYTSEGGGCNPAFGMTCCSDRPAPHGCHGTDGTDGGDGAVGQNGGDGGDGGSGGGVYNDGNLTIDNCVISNNEAGNAGDSGAGGNGGNGGNGGDGGGGGKADLFSTGEGGTGGDAGSGGNGGNGGDGGKAGDGGGGGGISTNTDGGAKLFIIGDPANIVDNEIGAGSTVTASAGAAGTAGAAGLAGPGGMNGADNTTSPFADDGADGTAGTGGTAGTEGEAGIDGSVLNYSNVPTVTTLSTGTDDDDLTTAVSGGSVTDKGGADIEARGVCWNTATEPNIVYHSKTTDDTGNTEPGTFTSEITGLTLDTTYYFRAYATNAEGTGYGTELIYVTEVQDPTVTTGILDTDAITITTASCTDSSVDKTGGAEITVRGVCWSTTDNPTLSDNEGTTDENTNVLIGSFTSLISGLTPDKTYYVRAYAENAEAKIGYGLSRELRTLPLLDPSVDTDSAEPDAVLPQKEIDLNGNVTDNGNADITARGAVWSTLPDPEINDGNSKYTNVNTNASTGPFTTSITGLMAGTAYFVRAYATNMGGTGYGDTFEIATTALKTPDVSTASVPEDTVYQRTATANGRVNMTGGADITARGVCWSTDSPPAPGIDDSCTTDDTSNTGINDEPYESIITGLTHSTYYYVRAYATNSEGTGYGEQRTFTTMAAGEPIVETDSSTTEVLSTSAILGGNVLADGGADLLSKGICWNTSPFAVDADKDDLECSTEDNTATGAIEGKLTGLNFDTTYYARAYATNGLGTAFGPDPIVNFTTDSAEKAKVTLADNYITIIIEVTQQSAKFIAKVTDDGDAHVTAKGFVWNTSGLPIVDSGDKKTVNGDGIGPFEGSTPAGELEAGKTYYVRAYATNAVATAYGKQERFTLKSEPTVATGEATVVTSSSATITGNNIVSDGGNDVTVSGVCYGISANPSATCTADGDTDEGQFTSQITGLDPETTYYVRAYATNSEGTSYGNDKTFKTVIVVDKGDVDGDGNVDLQDAILALKVLAGLNPQDVYVGADVNGDGQIGIEEVIFILRKVMA